MLKVGTSEANSGFHLENFFHFRGAEEITFI